MQTRKGNKRKTEALPGGLRARKKAKTQAAIQQAALVLFREKGYAATTVEQIAAAAEVSPSTFYRYFETKEDVALFDFFDPLVIQAFASHSVDGNLIQATRAAIQDVYGALSAEEKAKDRERVSVVVSVPELRMRMVDSVTQMIPQGAHFINEQSGRAPGDIGTLSILGAITGIMLAVYLSASKHPDRDIPSMLDEALAELEGFRENHESAERQTCPWK
jgi:AcrR family transcriptional regulator